MKSDFTDFDITLRDGRAVHIRAMRPADEAEILQAFDRLSPDARYMRFMRTVREPNLERLRKTLASFPACGLGIVATVPAADGIDIVGTAIFVLGSDPSTCEFAITIAADYGGAGLGRTLLTALIDAAKRRGLEGDGGLRAGGEQADAGARRPRRVQRRDRPRGPFHSPLPSASLASFLRALRAGDASDQEAAGRASSVAFACIAW